MRHNATGTLTVACLSPRRVEIRCQQSEIGQKAEIYDRQRQNGVSGCKSGGLHFTSLTNTYNPEATHFHRLSILHSLDRVPDPTHTHIHSDSMFMNDRNSSFSSSRPSTSRSYSSATSVSDSFFPPPLPTHKMASSPRSVTRSFSTGEEQNNLGYIYSLRVA